MNMERIKYGELVVLGQIGFLSRGNRGRKRKKFVITRRRNPNGVKKVKGSPVKNSNSPQAAQHLTSAVCNYIVDENTDMFQFGRSAESCNDFVVMDWEKISNKNATKSSIPRFAFRLVANRNSPNIVRIYAGGFNHSKIFLGEKASKWQENGAECDGITTNGLYIMHPSGNFYGSEAKCSLWMETSVNGKLYLTRKSRSIPLREQPIEGKTNLLKDGSLINLGKITLLWRSAEGLAKSLRKVDLKLEVDKLNASLNGLFGEIKNLQHPYIHIECGHLQLLRECKLETMKCPICLDLGPIVKLIVGAEPGFYVNLGPLTHAFTSCGHTATEETIKYWASIGIPSGTNDYRAICPFCALPLTTSPGYVKLILLKK